MTVMTKDTALLINDAEFLEYNDEGQDYTMLRLGLFWDEVHSEWVVSALYFDTNEAYGVPFRGHNVPALFSSAIAHEEMRPSVFGEHQHLSNDFEPQI